MFVENIGGLGNAPPEPEELRDWLGLGDSTHDIYAIGMQV
jgi:hypothetical protein